VIDDLPKLWLACTLAVLALLALWLALDHRSSGAARVRRAWRTRAFRRAAALVVLVLAVVVIAEDVLEAEHEEWVLRLDAQIIAALAESPAALRGTAALVSRLTGEGLVVALIAAIAALGLGRRRRDAMVLAAAALGAWGASGLFKVLFLVPRPRAHDMLRITASYGFPSGHALVTLVAFGTLAWLLAKRGSRRRIVLMVLAWTLAVSAGCARVILYAHWPSDVAASLALGALWLVVLPAFVGESRRSSAGAVVHVATTPSP
jgi:undecaprenyl-diphosphatase